MKFFPPSHPSDYIAYRIAVVLQIILGLSADSAMGTVGWLALALLTYLFMPSKPTGAIPTRVRHES